MGEMQASEIAARSRGRMAPTDISNPKHFHKVVDCQWACPTHTPVPEYIRLIAQRRYAAGLHAELGEQRLSGHPRSRVRSPCEPACRRGRVEEKPVAICR
jgi:NADPH-dependent glutamate synthase beta subunit-like oxidoreductase